MAMTGNHMEGQMSRDQRASMVVCPVCGSARGSVFAEMRQVPVHCNVLWPTREGALGAPRGDVRLAFCGECGHVFNTAFDPGLMEYTQLYENSLHFSPRFQKYAESLAARLVDQYDLRGKDIIEIGCGKGEFLTLLCELGGNRGVGFDPSYEPDRSDGQGGAQITFIQDFYSEQYAGYEADFICCRHVLEHIQEPIEFLTSVRRAVVNRPKTVVFFEVPNALSTLRDLAIWDIIYEHPSYFCPSSLAHAFRWSGCDVQDLGQAFGGQFLYVEALPGQEELGVGSVSEDAVQEVARDVEAFGDRYRSKRATWRRNLQRLAEAGQRTAVWGAGSKGVTFLNTVPMAEQIEYVVDINPHKAGMYVAGTGQEIVPPDALRHHSPDVVIVMNPIYTGEIQEHVSKLGVTADLLPA